MVSTVTPLLGEGGQPTATAARRLVAARRGSAKTARQSRDSGRPRRPRVAPGGPADFNLIRRRRKATRTLTAQNVAGSSICHPASVWHFPTGSLPLVAHETSVRWDASLVAKS